MLTANVLQRVFHIRAGSNTGTAFTVDHDGKQYLVTAAHVIQNLSEPYQIEVYHENRWKQMLLKLTGICSVADTAVFVPPYQLSPSFALPADSGGLIYGQEVYFLGFPYGILSDLGPLNRDFPMPLVKRACLSAFFDQPNGALAMLLDGHNNPGFSGGPVVFAEYGKPVASAYKVMAVVSGYRFAEEPVYHGSAATPVVVRANTGIVICYNIKHAVDEIANNPNGCLVKA